MQTVKHKTQAGAWVLLFLNLPVVPISRLPCLLLPSLRQTDFPFKTLDAFAVVAEHIFHSCGVAHERTQGQLYIMDIRPRKIKTIHHKLKLLLGSRFVKTALYQTRKFFNSGFCTLPFCHTALV